MSFSVDVLAGIAIELQSGIGHQDRFQRLITTLRQVLECDASALLRYESRQFIPLAIDGLAQDVLGRRFTLEGHPRLEAIARAGDVVRFPADSDLPDPYDGLIPGQESLKVHACIGLPLFAGQNLIGALTLDGMEPDQFDVFSDEELRLIAALAAGALSNALLIEQLESQNMLPGSSTNFEQVTETQMIGLSPNMMQLKKEIEIVAGSDLNVLISGETGTGKELVAKAIHEGSPRAVNPLVYLNCAALPETVAESELFGHVKGAFTGAISNRSGKFEMADNGTLFLDEIGELSLALQAKLLRVLQYGDIQRVGDDRSLRVDVRVLAAKFDGVIDVAAQTSDYWFRLYDHKTYQTYYGEDAGLTGTIETHPNPAGGKEIYLRVNLTLKNGIGVEAEYYGVPTAATADAMDEETLKPVKPFEPYIKFLDKDNKDMLYWPVTAMEVRHDPAYRDSYTGDLLSGYCFYFRNAFTESIDADNTTPMFFLPDSYLDHEGEIDLPAEGTNCKWNLRFQYMYLSSYNGYGYSDKAKYCMRCPEKAAVTVKQENKKWIFKFSMVDWGVFSTWNPDPTGTGNTLIIEFRGKADKYSGSKPNDLADDFYE